MNESIEGIHYSPINNYRYNEFFQDIQPNGKALDEAKKAKLLEVIDRDVELYVEGISLTAKSLTENKDRNDPFHETCSVIYSVSLFLDMTAADSMVASKYFMLANKDYDRRFLRGKMRVIINEGFKKLYGFDSKTNSKSEWKRIEKLLVYFPDEIKRQYYQLTDLLEKHSKSSSWWRDERNAETHLDSEKLYRNRSEEINESEVMLDSLKLFNTLYAVNMFLSNMHTCIYNLLVDKYRRGELRED